MAAIVAEAAAAARPRRGRMPARGGCACHAPLRSIAKDWVAGG